MADGLSDVIEDSNAEIEDAEQAATYWTMHEDSAGVQGGRAQGRTPVTGHEVLFQGATPKSTDDGTLPAPDPMLFARYDGSRGPGETREPSPAQGLVGKVKKALG